MDCCNPNLFVSGRFKGPAKYCSPDQIAKGKLRACEIHCVNCRLRKGRSEADCHMLESLLHAQSYFLTFTYANQGNNELCYRDIQLFKKAIKIASTRAGRTNPKFMNVHEFGGKNKRRHWHLMAYGLDLFDLEKDKFGNFSSKFLSKYWPHGHITIGSVEDGSAMYCSMYMQKDLVDHKLDPKFKSKVNHKGIGTSWFLANYEQVLSLGYIPRGDRKMAIPRKFWRAAQRHLDICTLSQDDYFRKYHKKAFLSNALVCIKFVPDPKLAFMFFNFKNFVRDIVTGKQIGRAHV